VPTNLAIDDKLIEAAVKAGRHKTKREAVTAALEEYLRMHQRRAVVAAFGTIEFHDDVNEKKPKRRRRGA
jgi:Arc/MetJ family transcription regulator